MMNAVIYCRLATQQQGNSSRLNDQEKTCKEYAKKHDIEVVKTIKEVGSGMDFKRPGLQKVLNFIKQGKAKLVIVTDLNRISRI